MYYKSNVVCNKQKMKSEIIYHTFSESLYQYLANGCVVFCCWAVVLANWASDFWFNTLGFCLLLGPINFSSFVPKRTERIAKVGMNI